MALDEFTRERTREMLDHYCRTEVPAHAQHQVRVTWRFWRDSVILYEERKLPWNPDCWSKMKIARMDFDAESKGWTLRAYDRNDRPFVYSELRPRSSLETVLQEIDEDPTCIFWG
jgi:hypothetical protein